MSVIGFNVGYDVSPARVACGAAVKIGRACFFVGVLLVLAGNQVLSQENSKPLSPTESYKAALAAFTATRSQANDLTDADKLALGIGMAQAARACLTLSANTSAFANDAKELFALAQLCIFGEQFEPARAALVNYLARPQPPQREQALLLLVRALLGLKEPVSAEPQVRSLLRDYPYDAPIHFAIDQVIDDTEGAGTHLNEVALQLCATQNAVTLPLLASGKALESKDGSASAATLFADAVRCDALARASGKPSSLQQLAGIIQQSDWAGTTDLEHMHTALQRQLMVGSEVPLQSIHGRLLGANTLMPRTLSLAHDSVLLIPFTLWSPSMPETARDLARFAPQQPIYAITSWRANTGHEDMPSSQVLNGLRSWQKSLPLRILILIVPDTELNSFHADSFPAGILIRDGIVLSNGVLSSQGAERLLVNTLIDRTTGLAGPDRKRLSSPGPNSNAN